MGAEQQRAGSSRRGRGRAGTLARARVSSERQPERGAGRERQRRALAAACRRRGWRVLESLEEAGPAAQERNAAGREQAVRLRASGAANALLAAKHERPEQALGELAALLASAQKQGWALVALDYAAQTTTPAAASATVLASFAPCERRSISERTKAALARKRARRASGSAGRRRCPPTRSSGSNANGQPAKAWPRSPNGLNADRVPTAQGGRHWYPATIRYTLKRTP
jgi:DNA invertase Pin-like site-specific DNA recombinase